MAKLAALVRDQWGPADDRTPAGFPGGAALKRGDEGWVLAENEPVRGLGGALAWGWRNQIERLHVLVEDKDGARILTRRAALFVPAPDIWEIKSRFLVEPRPMPLPDHENKDFEAAIYEDVFETAGADAVVEHGILRAEVLGLEVARVEDGRLLVGVGKHDREAHQLARPDRAAAEALVETVTIVQEYRRAGAGAHPANQLAVERWLRAVVVARPELVGLPGAKLRPVANPVERLDLRQPAPAAAVGDGVMVACSVGIDTDLVPAAADAWAAHGRPPRLLLAVPEKDDHAITRALAERLVQPAEIVTVPSSWRETGVDA